jgi:hypothetical protein
MRYFFDESGNWQEKEHKKLVIGGIVVKDEDDWLEIRDRIREFKLERSFRNLHANEMEGFDREAFLEVILSLLEEERFRAVLYVVDPDVLLKTQKESDEVYADIASDLLSEIAFGDSDIDVEYDMKFHYAYPAQIVENIENNVSSYEFERMKDNFWWNNPKRRPFKYENSGIFKQKSRIINNLKKSKIIDYKEIERKMNDKESGWEYVYNYLWEEFRLKIEKGAIIREKFKEKSETKLKEKYKMFNMNIEPKIRINYKGKHNQSEGVEIIDFLTNIVRHHGKNPRSYSPAVVKDIYKFIEVKEKDA